MDTNALQESMQLYREPRRRELILEARHSKCIEASNKIRSKLSPRLFMPRAPIYRHTTKTQHCPKELKTKFFKSQNLTTTDFAKELNPQKKCQTQSSESFVKRLRGKFSKRSQRDQYFKTMENITDNNSYKRSKHGEHKRSKEVKTDKNAAKRMKKQQGLSKTANSATKAQKSSANCKTRKSKEEVKLKWGNLKIIANENSSDNTRYLTDGEIVFIEHKDQEEMNSYCRSDSNKTVKTTGTYYFESSYHRRDSQQSREENCHRTTYDKSHDESKFYDQTSQRTADENPSKSQIKTCRHSKSSSIQIASSNNRDFTSDNSENSSKISVEKSPDYSAQKSVILTGLPIKVLENSQQNSTETNPIQNSTTLQIISKDSTCDKIRNYLKLQNNTKEFYIRQKPVENFRENQQLPLNDNRVSQFPDQLTSRETNPLLNCTTTLHYKPYLTHNEYSFEGTIPVVNMPTEEYNRAQTVANFKETVKDQPKSTTKQNLTNPLPPTSPQNSVPIPKPSKPSTIFKPYLTNTETSKESSPLPKPSSTLTLPKPQATSTENNSCPENSLLQLPLETYLNRASSAVADFQDTVHSSLSLIYDCSIIDKNIHEDLINLENSVDSFNKYLLQSYKDMELMDLKTNNCLEYLNSKNMNRRFQDQQLRSQNSSLNKPTNFAQTQETVTILIEADKMPITTITFKTSDIICPKLNLSDNGMSSTKNPNATAQERRNVKRKNSDIAIVSNIKLTNNDVLNQIIPRLSTSPAAGNNISKLSSKESCATTKLADNPINSLQTFVEESMQKPVYSNKAENSFGLLREARESSHITYENLNCSNQGFVEQEPDQQDILQHIPRKGTIKTSSSNSQKLRSESIEDSNAVNELSNRSSRNSKNSRTTESSISGNPYNLIYTQAQTNYTTFASHNPLRSYRIPNHLPRTITSQASSRNSVTLTNSYNYPRVNENPYDDHHQPNYRPHVYPYSPYLNREPQVPNQNYSYYKPPNYIRNRERNRNSLNSLEVPYHTQYPKSVLNMPYLPNPYRYHHYPDLATYYRPYFDNNSNKFPTTHFPSSRDFDGRHHSVFHTNSQIPPEPVQNFANTTYRDPND